MKRVSLQHCEAFYRQVKYLQRRQLTNQETMKQELLEGAYH